MPDVTRPRTRPCAALLLSLLLIPSGPTVGQDAKFGEATSVVVVEVPVQVLADGKPVRGLTAENFEVYDGRKRQQITGFEVVNLARPAAAAGADQTPPAEVPIAGRRHFLLLFDFATADPAALLKARDAAKDLVADLHPADLVGVASYTPTRGPALVMGFTSDRSHVAAAIESLGLPEFAPKAIDPAGLVFGDLQGAQNVVRDSLGRGGSTGLREALEDLSRLSGKADIEAQRNQVVAMSRSMSEMARAMAGIQGRKHVVLLSEGFDSSLLFASEDEEDTQQQNQAIESGEIWKVDSDERFGSTRTQSVLTDMLEEFKRADCTIQAVNIGGLRAAGEAASGSTGGRNQASGQDGLFAMAAGTGGELFRNFNDLSQAMGQVLENTSVSYVLAFQPDDLELDGKFHRLRVELKGAPRGARLVARPGYYAPKPAKQLTPIEQRLETAEQVLGAGGGPIAVSVLAAPFSTGSMLAYVPVVIEVDGRTLLDGTTGDVVNAEIYAYGIAASGGVRDYFGQSLGLELQKVRQSLEQGGLKFYGHLDLEPDDYTVRVLVRNGQSGRSSVAVVPLTVPDFESAGPVLLPAFFPETPGRWVLARETAEQGGAQPDYPFVLKEESYIPAAKPVVRQGEAARVALVAYNFGPGDIPVQGKVLDREGREVAGGRLAVLERTATGRAGIDRLRASFEAGTLAPGEYTLEVSATDPATGRRQSSTAPFVVAGGAARGR